MYSLAFCRGLANLQASFVVYIPSRCLTASAVEQFPVFFVSTRQNQPEYLYFSPSWLNLLGIAGAIAVAAISSFLVVKIWAGIDVFAQRLRTAAVAAIEQRMYAVPEP